MIGVVHKYNCEDKGKCWLASKRGIQVSRIKVWTAMQVITAGSEY
jgi:hypothetical protein